MAIEEVEWSDLATGKFNEAIEWLNENWTHVKLIISLMKLKV